MRVADWSLQVMGVFSLLLAVEGILYAVVYSLFGLWKSVSGSTYYVPIHVMSGICVVCCVLLFLCGVHFVRLRTRMLPVFVSVLLFEILYFVALGLFHSAVVSVSGHESFSQPTDAILSANGGLAFQGITLFPVWAPIVAVWAVRRLRREGETGCEEAAT